MINPARPTTQSPPRRTSIRRHHKRLDEHRNINPCSEVAFETLKYAPVFSDRFGPLADARAFAEKSFDY